MKAALVTPYLDTLGGGERYVLSVAKALEEEGWTVHVESKDENILKRSEERFHLGLKSTSVVPSVRRGDGYDLCFWLSDGSIPFLSARKNILHFQRPFYKVDGKSLLNRMKFFRIKSVVVNSKFTKEWIDKEFPVESKILYPPVDVAKLTAGKKQNLILYVGRFSQLEQSKRQDILVEAFIKLYKLGYKEWKLVLAGGSDVGRTSFLDELKEKSKGYPIEILENAPFSKIKDLFSKAKLFWSASGYGVDVAKNPEKVEHFGITVVEAMKSGAVPLIYDAGGHREIVTEGENGLLWDSKEILVRATIHLSKNPDLIKHFAKRAIESSHQYSYERFKKELLALL